MLLSSKKARAQKDSAISIYQFRHCQFVLSLGGEGWTGWLPIAGQDKGHLPKVMEALQRRGRKKSDITLAMFGVPPDEDFVNQKLKEGFTHLVFGLPPAGEDRVLPLLDKYAEIARKHK